VEISARESSSWNKAEILTIIDISFIVYIHIHIGYRGVIGEGVIELEQGKYIYIDNRVCVCVCVCIGYRGDIGEGVIEVKQGSKGVEKSELNAALSCPDTLR
jgi:hypothetical protein